MVGRDRRARRNSELARRSLATAGIVFLSLLLNLALPTAGASDAPDDPILIFAAASLSDVLTEVGEAFETEEGTRVTVHCSASSMLARQIRMGAPADVFLSADEAKMDDLEGADLLVPSTRRSLFRNQLVVVVPEDSDLKVSVLADLADPAFTRIVLADPRSVPAGIYAHQVLVDQGLWARLASRLIPVANVRSALAAVETGNADAGFVYLTDALSSEQVSIRFRVPLDQDPAITYPVAVIRRDHSKPAAIRFVDFLAEPGAGRIFVSHGFRLLDASEAISVDPVETTP